RTAAIGLEHSLYPGKRLQQVFQAFLRSGIPIGRSGTMLRNYLKTALRIFVRQKSTATLNIAGLTLGITSSLILFLLVRHLASYDSFHTNADRIYRVVTHMQGNAGRFHTPGVPPPLPDAFREDFPEAEVVTFTSSRSQDRQSVV